jgi:hypothetical protein
MREDEDHFRHTMPVLRRVIILVAVLTAIPVVMWTITAFVRTYVAPPKAPTYQPIAASRLTGAPDEAAAAPAEQPSVATAHDANAPLSTTAEARATATDAGANVPAGTTDGPDLAANGTQTNGSATDGTPSGTLPTVTAPAGVTNVAVVNHPAGAAPGGASTYAMQFAAQPPAAANWPAPTPTAADDALPSEEPLSGKVPLPRKRPHNVVMAQAGGIPLPLPRPEAAGPGAPPAANTPLNWLHNVFQPPSAAAAPSSENDNTGDRLTPQ